MLDGFFGWAGLETDTSDLNERLFHIRQSLREFRTAVPVVVKSVKDGGVGKPPTVSVQPLLAQTDGQGNATQHGIVYGIPVMRIQGGKSAVIIDPVVGDVGIMLVSDRDLSALKANDGALSNPGSYRVARLSDGVYLGAILNKDTPTQYIQMTQDTITIHDKTGNEVVMSSSGIKLTASGGVDINGTVITSTGEIQGKAGITAGHGGGDSVGLQTHEHTANNTPPTPGS